MRDLAGFTGQGFRIFEIWETLEDFQRFVEKHLLPVLKEVVGPDDGSEPEDPLKSSTQSNSRIVHHALGVKHWMASPPSVEEARPGMCVVCGAASRPCQARR